MAEQYDLVMIGVGEAGTSAVALALQTDEDIDVLLLERAPKEKRAGNSRYTEMTCLRRSCSRFLMEFW